MRVILALMIGTSSNWPNILPNRGRIESSGALPGPHLLRSAARVLNIIGRARHTDSDLMSSYLSTASGGIMSSAGLLRAERWLVDHGWLERIDTTLFASDRCQALPSEEAEVARELVRAAILDSMPTWLSAVVVRGVVRPELLPEQVESVLDDMFAAHERDAILHAAATKYDEDALRRIGDAGEEAVIAASRSFLEERGRPDLAHRVRRVSLISDGLGYDVVTPDVSGRECRLEVKCYRGRYPRFYITRNEYEVGLILPRWFLVLCRYRPDYGVSIVGWMTLKAMISGMPVDIDRSARWQVASIRVHESDLQPGLPLIRLA